MTSAVDFVNRLADFKDRIALSDDDGHLSYAQLAAPCGDNTQVWRQHTQVARPLVLLKCHQSITTIVNYLTCLANNWPVMMVNDQVSDDALNDMIARMQPNILVNESEVTSLSQLSHNMDVRLALLLSTSGSTGGGKWVALSAANINANTQSIIDYLPIESSDTAIASLPFSYSYGLSVLHTHLAKGAQLTLTRHTVMEREFWALLSDRQVTSLAGVPHWYEMLSKLRFTRRVYPALRYFTQAGGKLQAPLIKEFADYADNHNKQFYVMYGQTEATARMAYLHPSIVSDKPYAIGQAIPGGEFRLTGTEGESITATGVEGELCYKGDNVMLGYVQEYADLATFSHIEWLSTGDLACCDEDGDYIISGRKSRFIKLFGERVNLDGLETLLSQKGLQTRCCGEDNTLVVASMPAQIEQVTQAVKVLVQCPPKALMVVAVESWPLLANGKTDYRALNQQALGSKDGQK